MIFDPSEHEPLAAGEWDEVFASSFVGRIVREADDAYDAERGWPLHPEDQYGVARTPFSGLYHGGAGTMWALTHLARTNGIRLRNDYGAAVARCETTYRDNPHETGTIVPSYFLGTVGIMMARYAITGDSLILDRIETELHANVGNPAREALWGSPGTALAALLLRERNGDDRYDEILRLCKMNFGQPGTRRTELAHCFGNRISTDGAVVLWEPRTVRSETWRPSFAQPTCFRLRGKTRY